MAGYHLEAQFTRQREAEWAEFVADRHRCGAELDGELAKGTLTLAEQVYQAREHGGPG
jgi:hypothetical protein